MLTAGGCPTSIGTIDRRIMRLCYIARMILITAVVVLGLLMMGLNFIIVTKPRRWSKLDEKAEARFEERLNRVDREEN